MRWRNYWAAFRAWRLSEIIGLVLAIIALGVGIYHLAEIRQTVGEVNRVRSELSKQLRQSEDSLRQVRETLSTRYLGKFPEFLPQIVDTVQSSHDRLTIFCDFPGYGAFSDPANQTRYIHAIEEKRLKPHFSVDLTCMDYEHRHAYVNEQFASKEWDVWDRDPQKRKRVAEFCDAHGIPRKSIQTRAELITAIEGVGLETLRHTFLNSAHEVPEKLPIYFWMADDRKSAIFSIPAVSTGAVEYGFATSDRDLMNALLEVRNRYIRDMADATPSTHNR